MHIGIAGATGAVGRMMMSVLHEMDLPVHNLELFASKRSAGQQLMFRNKPVAVQELTEEAMRRKYDYLLFSAGSGTSLRFAPIAAEAGNTVIDNSSAFRRDDTIPLIVPEINGDLLRDYNGIVANPNCSTIQLVMALHPLALKYGLKRVLVTTFQSVSGAGNKGIRELENQRNGSSYTHHFPRQIDLNVIPQIGAFDKSGYCEEELKMHHEIRKILRDDTIEVSAETVRVPVLYGHSESVYVELKVPVSPTEAAQVLQSNPGITLHLDDYITPHEIGDSDDSHVCRIRQGCRENELRFWNVAHNVRLGAATNAIRIIKTMISLANK